MHLIVSRIKDNNIFHVFAFDLIKYYHPKYNKAIIISSDLDLENSVQKWRLFVMNKLYKNVTYSIENLVHKNRVRFTGYDCFKFIEYEQSNHMYNIYRKLSPKEVPDINKRYILLHQRDLDNRYAYDYHTREKLEDYLLSQELKLPLKICNFTNMTPEEQYNICSQCAVFVSVHGAGSINLIFTPQDCPFIEINFRKHWYCDNVCDEHFNNDISINEKCDGKLNYRPSFHKADYHNLCYLIGKKYLEIEAIEYGEEGFNNRSPISKKKIYIDGNHLVNKINSFLI